MPACLEPYRDLTRTYSWDARARQTLLQALSRALPETAERARALFEWFGSRSGSWHNSPAYERLPQELLHDIPVPELAAALDSDAISAEHLEGASRYFAVGVLHDNAKVIEVDQIPETVRQRLLEHSQKSEHENNRNVALTVFR